MSEEKTTGVLVSRLVSKENTTAVEEADVKEEDDECHGEDDWCQRRR